MARHRWSLKHDRCIECGTTAIPHGGKGRCGQCRKRLLYKPRAKPERSIRARARFEQANRLYEQGATQTEIARTLGVTKERARQYVLNNPAGKLKSVPRVCKRCSGRYLGGRASFYCPRCAGRLCPNCAGPKAVIARICKRCVRKQTKARQLAELQVIRRLRRKKLTYKAIADQLGRHRHHIWQTLADFKRKRP